MLLSCLAYSSALKTEGTCPSENTVDFKLTIRRYIPKIKVLITTAMVKVKGKFNPLQAVEALRATRG
jgi:hypothetical protein